MNRYFLTSKTLSQRWRYEEHWLRWGHCNCSASRFNASAKLDIRRLTKLGVRGETAHEATWHLGSPNACTRRILLLRREGPVWAQPRHDISAYITQRLCTLLYDVVLLIPNFTAKLRETKTVYVKITTAYSGAFPLESMAVRGVAWCQGSECTGLVLSRAYDHAQPRPDLETCARLTLPSPLPPMARALYHVSNRSVVAISTTKCGL